MGRVGYAGSNLTGVWKTMIRYFVRLLAGEEAVKGICGASRSMYVAWRVSHVRRRSLVLPSAGYTYG